MGDSLRDVLPLSPAALSILLALADQERHGYGILKEVERQSAGRSRLGPGTLYDNLRRMSELGWIAEDEPPAGADPRRRRSYRLTGLGRRVAVAEIDRLEGVLREGRRRLGAQPKLEDAK